MWAVTVPPVVFQCRLQKLEFLQWRGAVLTKFLQWHSSVGLFQLSFSSGVPVYPASIRWIAQWYPSVGQPVAFQWHSSVHWTSQCTLAEGKGPDIRSTGHFDSWARVFRTSGWRQSMAISGLRSQINLLCTLDTIYLAVVTETWFTLLTIFAGKSCGQNDWSFGDYAGCDLAGVSPVVWARIQPTWRHCRKMWSPLCLSLRDLRLKLTDLLRIKLKKTWFRWAMSMISE